jgi:enoyl-CoA hydratase
MLLIEKADGVAVLTMNRPEAMNALSQALRTALAAAFADMERDDEIKAVILTGAGERAFTAGIDLKELGKTGPASLEAPGPDLVQAMQACQKPIIGAINGVAITGGFELALACDVLLASTNARFADTHARVGVAPGWGLSQRLSRVIGPYRAKELSLSGNFLDAQTALAWGLVNRVTAPEALLPAARALAGDMASVPLEMLKFYKTLIDDGYELPLGEALALEAQRSGPRNAATTAEQIEKNRIDVLARGRRF